ncbi:unnamed protein product [Caenorhabditis angaria]|uniref:DUF38 domain-containing protein n=1 Tax=Caenorhabditis angaria TaxID=860376 RepID=A0A9P1N767_9PELO|nr:unnamed protein product [Caenorhabditis angaria]
MRILIAIFLVSSQISAEQIGIEKYFECIDIHDSLSDFLDICGKNIRIYRTRQRTMNAYTASSRNEWFFDLNLDIPIDTLLNSNQFLMVMKDAIIDEVTILELGDLDTIFIHKNICVFTLDLDLLPEIEEYVRRLILDRKFVVVLRNREIVFWNFNNVKCLQNE